MNCIIHFAISIQLNFDCIFLSYILHNMSVICCILKCVACTLFCIQYTLHFLLFSIFMNFVVKFPTGHDPIRYTQALGSFDAHFRASSYIYSSLQGTQKRPFWLCNFLYYAKMLSIPPQPDRFDFFSPQADVNSILSL